MSPRHTSAQRRRKAAKPLAAHEIEALLDERVRSAAAGSAVIAIEAELAGYFDNLGFRLDLAPTVSDAEALELSNKILAELAAATSGLEMPFSWSVGLYRSDQLLQAVDAKSVPQWICSGCQTDHHGYFDTCPFCGSPRP